MTVGPCDSHGEAKAYALKKLYQSPLRRSVGWRPGVRGWLGLPPSRKLGHQFRLCSVRDAGVGEGWPEACAIFPLSMHGYLRAKWEHTNDSDVNNNDDGNLRLHCGWDTAVHFCFSWVYIYIEYNSYYRYYYNTWVYVHHFIYTQ